MRGSGLHAPQQEFGKAGTAAAGVHGILRVNPREPAHVTSDD